MHDLAAHEDVLDVERARPSQKSVFARIRTCKQSHALQVSKISAPVIARSVIALVQIRPRTETRRARAGPPYVPRSESSPPSPRSRVDLLETEKPASVTLCAASWRFRRLSRRPDLGALLPLLFLGAGELVLPLLCRESSPNDIPA